MGTFQSSLIQLCSETFLLTLLLPESSISIPAYPRDIQRNPKKWKLISIPPLSNFPRLLYLHPAILTETSRVDKMSMEHPKENESTKGGQNMISGELN